MTVLGPVEDAIFPIVHVSSKHFERLTALRVKRVGDSYGVMFRRQSGCLRCIPSAR